MENIFNIVKFMFIIIILIFLILLPGIISNMVEIEETKLDSLISIQEKAYKNKLPYLWGGNTWSGADCSGSQQLAYKTIGVYLPRTAQDQYKFQQISNDSLIDMLIFFNNFNNRIFHVGFSPFFQHIKQDSILCYHNKGKKYIYFRKEYLSPWWTERIVK